MFSAFLCRTCDSQPFINLDSKYPETSPPTAHPPLRANTPLTHARGRGWVWSQRGFNTMKKIQYSVAMQPNPMKPDEEKKAYANLQLTGIVNINELADHIAEHNSVFSKGTIVGILTELSVCMRELILQGYKIELGDLGTFAPSISSQGAKTKDEFTSQNIKVMTVNFNNGKAFANLRRDAEFERTTTRRAQAAALKAENEGKTNADWTPEPEETPEP